MTLITDYIKYAVFHGLACLLLYHVLALFKVKASHFNNYSLLVINLLICYDLFMI